MKVWSRHQTRAKLNLSYYVQNKRKISSYISYKRKIHELERVDSSIEEEEVLEFHGLISKSNMMRDIYNMIEKVAPSKANILITGETGTGKEEVAKAIHKISGRGNWVKQNCGDITDSLAGSTLFGHEKGSFTGADRQREGIFEQADGGTLFLNEIENMNLSLQAQLLDVIQDREVKRIGQTSEPKKVDIRIISATNIDIGELIKERKFREDLYYRLCAIPIEIPPLRERKEDISPLIDLFMKLHAKNKPDLKISPITRTILENYDWPGNVRTLGNLIERLVTLVETDTIYPYQLPDDIRKNKTKDDINQKQVIIESLERHKGNVSKVINELGKGYGRTRLYELMKEFGINVDDFRITKKGSRGHLKS